MNKPNPKRKLLLTRDTLATVAAAGPPIPTNPLATCTSVVWPPGSFPTTKMP